MRRWSALFGFALLLAGACDDKSLPRIAAASHVAETNPQRGALWPILLQHCLRSPSCDPMGRFDEGRGQASGVVGATTYFVESAAVVKEGGQDYGGRITLSLIAPRGSGGAAGRPLTLDETPSDLRGPRNRESWLSIEYRAPSGDPEPYFLAFRSARLALNVPGSNAVKGREALANLTGDYVANLSFGKLENGQSANGAKIVIAGKAGVLFTGYSIGLPGGAKEPEKGAPPLTFEPWYFYASRNLRDDKAELAGLMKAIDAGETLDLAVSLPDGLVLRDAIYTTGFARALADATAALKDVEHLAAPLTERCAPYLALTTTDWDAARPSAAERTCDPRGPDDKTPARPPIKPGPAAP